jgi:hypothetical protein
MPKKSTTRKFKPEVAEITLRIWRDEKDAVTLQYIADDHLSGQFVVAAVADALDQTPECAWSGDIRI